MTSTISKTTPGMGLGGPDRHNGSAMYVEEGGGDSLPGEVELTVVLPSGDTRSITVDTGKQMMDLLVQVAASNKLSPTSHMLCVYDEAGNQKDFKASQSVGALDISIVYILPKGSKQKNAPKISTEMPFEKTQRLTVNLPRGQKTVLRISPKASLGQIYQKICADKSLDPYKFELRHPTVPDEPLNMSRPLMDYRLNEITVVSVSTPDSPPPSEFSYTAGPTQRQTSTSSFSSVTSAGSMPRRKQNSTEDAPAYMPGASKEKKKKGLFSFFSRKKGATSFSPHESPPASETSTTVSQPVFPSHENQQWAAGAAGPTPAGPAPGPTPAQLAHEAAARRASQGHDQPQHQASQLAAAKSHKKKRQAPPPPPGGMKPVAGKPAEMDVNGAKHVNSRASSRSSGFEDAQVSPIDSPRSDGELPKNLPLKGKVSLDATSVSSSEASMEHIHGRPITERLPQLQEDRMSDASGSSDKPNKPLRRKKKAAPAPPPMAAAAAASVSSQEPPAVVTHAPVASPPAKTEVTTPSPALPEPPSQPVAMATTRQQEQQAAAAEAETVQQVVMEISSTEPVTYGDIPSPPKPVEVTKPEVADKVVVETVESVTVERSSVPESVPQSSVDAQENRDGEKSGSESDVSVFVKKMEKLTEKANSDANTQMDISKVPEADNVKASVSKSIKTETVGEGDEAEKEILNEKTVQQSVSVTSVSIEHNVDNKQNKSEKLVISETQELSAPQASSPGATSVSVVTIDQVLPDATSEVILVRKESKSDDAPPSLQSTSPLSKSVAAAEQGSPDTSPRAPVSPADVRPAAAASPSNVIPPARVASPDSRPPPPVSPADSGHSSSSLDIDVIQALPCDEEITFTQDEITYETPSTPLRGRDPDVPPPILTPPPTMPPPQSEHLQIVPQGVDTKQENKPKSPPSSLDASNKQQASPPKMGDIIDKNQSSPSKEKSPVQKSPPTKRNEERSASPQRREQIVAAEPDLADVMPDDDGGGEPDIDGASMATFSVHNTSSVPQAGDISGRGGVIAPREGEPTQVVASPPVTSLRAAYHQSKPIRHQLQELDPEIAQMLREEPLPIPYMSETRSQADQAGEPSQNKSSKESSVEISKSSTSVEQKRDPVTDTNVEIKQTAAPVSILKKRPTDLSPTREVIIIEKSKPKDVVPDKSSDHMNAIDVEPDPEEHSTSVSHKSARRPRDITFWSPRPYMAPRNKSEPSVKDVRAALAAAEKQSQQGQIDMKDDDMVGYKGDGSLRAQQIHPRVTEIRFTPQSENERENMMEEKSISQIAFPVERKSILRNASPPPPEGTTEQTVETPVSAYEPEPRMVRRRIERSERRQTAPSRGSFLLNFATSAPDIGKQIADSRESSAHELQNQYEQLQSQFARWQKQLQKNQDLLAEKGVVPTHQGARSPISEEEEEETSRKHYGRNVNRLKERFGSEPPMETNRLTKSVSHSDVHTTEESKRSTQSASPDIVSKSTVHQEKSVPQVRPKSMEVRSSLPLETPVADPQTEVRIARTDVKKTKEQFEKLKEGPTSSGQDPRGTRKPEIKLWETEEVAKPKMRQKDESKPAHRRPRPVTKGSFEITSSHKPVTTHFHHDQQPDHHHRVSSTSHRVSSKAASSRPVSVAVMSHPKPDPVPSSTSAAARVSVAPAKSPSSRGSASAPPSPAPPVVSEQNQNAPARASSKSKYQPKDRSNDPRFMPKLDPREELMIAIRSAGGKGVLRQVETQQTKWHYGSAKN